MDAVTYPDRSVQSLIADSVIPARFNLLERSDDMRELTRAAKIAWSPMFLVLDERRREIRRFLGWLPPADFQAEVRLALHYRDVLNRKFEQARGGLREVAGEFGQTAAAPEALFWAGICGFLGSDKDFAELAADWEEVRRRYPQSPWAHRASVIEDAGK